MIPKNVFSGYVFSSPSNPAYTVPANGTFIITSMIITQDSSSDSDIRVRVNNVVVLPNIVIPPKTIVTFDTRIVLHEGEKIWVDSTVNITTQINIDGIEVLP